MGLRARNMTTVRTYCFLLGCASFEGVVDRGGVQPHVRCRLTVVALSRIDVGQGFPDLTVRPASSLWVVGRNGGRT